MPVVESMLSLAGEYVGGDLGNVLARSLASITVR
jgi:hypothetical protein